MTNALGEYYIKISGDYAGSDCCLALDVPLEKNWLVTKPEHVREALTVLGGTLSPLTPSPTSIQAVLDAPDEYSVSTMDVQIDWQNMIQSVNDISQIVFPSTAESLNSISYSSFRHTDFFSDIDGSGYTIVVLDTGVYADYSYFGDRVVLARDYTNPDIDYSSEVDDCKDLDGHGTNVASIIASGDDLYPGVAKGVNIISFKVLSGNGSGNWRSVENALNGVIGLIDDYNIYNIVAVNMSLGVHDKDIGHGYNYDAFTEGSLGIDDQLAKLDELGIVCVCSAGNDYGYFNTYGVNYPAASEFTLAVGAVFDEDDLTRACGWRGDAWLYKGGWQRDRLCPFSQRSLNVMTALAPGAIISGVDNTGNIRGYTGTSQAAPHVTGMVALAKQILDVYREDESELLWSVDNFESVIRHSSDIVIDSETTLDNVDHYGDEFPRVNIYKMANMLLNYQKSYAINLNGDVTYLNNVNFGVSNKHDNTPSAPMWDIEPFAENTTTISMKLNEVDTLEPDVSYIVEEVVNIDENGNNLSSGWQQGLEFMFTNLLPGTSYFFKAKARGGDGVESEWSEPFMVATYTVDDVNPPVIPTNSLVILQQLSDSLKINVEPATDPESNGVEYYFECISGDIIDSGWIPEPEYVVSGLTYGLTYNFNVKVRDYNNNISSYGSVDPILMMPPSGDSLQVIISPEEAVNAGARWKLSTEQVWHKSGDEVQISEGEVYQIEYFIPDVAGWDAPDPDLFNYGDVDSAGSDADVVMNTTQISGNSNVVLTPFTSVVGIDRYEIQVGQEVDMSDVGEENYIVETIQDAIKRVGKDKESVILLPPGVYSGKGNRDILIKGLSNNITIKSTEPGSNTIINGYDYSNPNKKHYCIQAISYGQSDRTLKLDGLTMYGFKNGVLFMNNTNLELNDCIFGGQEDIRYWNESNSGSVLYCLSKFTRSLKATSCIFMNNSTTIINGNVYGSGGAAFLYNYNSEISNCIFENCNAARGGAIYSLGLSSELKLYNSDFRNNCGRVMGGAIVSILNNLSIDQCTFDNNKTDGALGGVLYLSNTNGTRNVTIYKSIFNDNLSASNGGAIYNLNCELDIEYSYFINNSTSALYQRSLFDVSIDNSIMWNNEDDILWPNNVFRDKIILNNSDIEDGWDHNGQGNISEDPLFVDLDSPAGDDGVYFTDDDGIILNGNSPCSELISDYADVIFTISKSGNSFTVTCNSSVELYSVAFDISIDNSNVYISGSADVEFPLPIGQGASKYFIDSIVTYDNHDCPVAKVGEAGAAEFPCYDQFCINMAVLDDVLDGATASDIDIATIKLSTDESTVQNVTIRIDNDELRNSFYGLKTNLPIEETITVNP